MNKQRKVVITITYNEMGIIIDTKAEEVTQPEKRVETHACDCISRQAAIDVLDALDITDGVGISSIACNLQEKAIRGIQKLPSVYPERKKGKWIDNETSYADGVRQTCTCSICGKRSVRPLGRFCRWCGADVGGDKDDQR